MFPYPNGKTPLCADSPTGCGAKRPSYWTGRLSYRIAFSPMARPFSETARPPVSPKPSSCPFPCLVKKSPWPGRWPGWEKPIPPGSSRSAWQPCRSRPRGVRPCSLRSTVLRREAIFPANTAGVWHGPPAARLPWARPASPPFGRKDTPPDSRPCAMRTPPAPCSARRSPTCAARSTPCRWRASSKTALPDCAAAGKTTPHSRPSICCRTCTPPCRTPSTSASTA